MTVKKLIIGLFFFSICLIVTGCQTTPIHINPKPSVTQIIQETISSTNWVMTIFILGAAASLFAGLNGLKVGWLALVSCIGGAFLKMALSVTWSYYFAGMVLIGAVVLAFVSIVFKNTVVKDLIVGGQLVKELYLKNKKQDVNNVLKVVQKTTQKYVKKVKTNLEKKGAI